MPWLLKGTVLAAQESVGKSKKNALTVLVFLSQCASRQAKTVEKIATTKGKEIKINLSILTRKMSSTGKNTEIKRILAESTNKTPY